MAQGKKTFTMYIDQDLIMKDCNYEEKGLIFEWIFDYVNDRNPEFPSDRYVKGCCEQFKQTFKRDLVKYELKCKKNSENGLKGGRPKGSSQNNPKKPTVNLGLKNNPKKANVTQANPKKPILDTGYLILDNDIRDKEIKRKEEIHRSFDHLKITVPQYQKLIKLYGSKAVDQKIDSLENMTSNKKYKTIHLTIGGWLKKDAPAVEDAPNKSIELMTWREFSDIKCKFDSWQREHRNGTNKKNPFIVGDEPALAELERTSSLEADPNAWQEMANEQIKLGIRHKHNFGY
ncbi:MAG: hypothetical protein HRU26_09080 [Psychroserpens sp.]|nr:hypothetical protein [Psychroserpens sp.]